MLTSINPIETTLAGLALKENGLGMIGYIELLDYEPTLKMAYQDGFKTYMPSVRH